MKKEYKLSEDLLLAIATVSIAAAGIIKVFGVLPQIGFMTVNPRTLAGLSIVCLLFNIALNIQDIGRK